MRNTSKSKQTFGAIYTSIGTQGWIQKGGGDILRPGHIEV